MSLSFTFFGLGQMYVGEYKRVVMIIGIAILIGGRKQTSPRLTYRVQCKVRVFPI